MIFQKISADEKSICDKCLHHGICMYEDNQPCFECTRFVDAAPVVHGRWKEADDGDGAVCSVCGEDFCNIYLEVERFNHCPNCGALMDLEVN